MRLPQYIKVLKNRLLLKMKKSFPMILGSFSRTFFLPQVQYGAKFVQEKQAVSVELACKFSRPKSNRKSPANHQNKTPRNRLHHEDEAD